MADTYRARMIDSSPAQLAAGAVLLSRETGTTKEGWSGSAVFTADRRYRYDLRRSWWPRVGSDLDVVWIPLNPSTAGAAETDQTLRQICAFSRREGFGSCTVVNLFGWISTDPDALRIVDDPVGPDNDDVIDFALRQRRTGLVVLAWGAPASHPDLSWRADDVRRLV